MKYESYVAQFYHIITHVNINMYKSIGIFNLHFCINQTDTVIVSLREHSCNICTCVYVYVYVCARVVCARARARVCVCVCVCVCVYVCMLHFSRCVCVYIYIYIYIYLIYIAPYMVSSQGASQNS